MGKLRDLAQTQVQSLAITLEARTRIGVKEQVSWQVSKQVNEQHCSLIWSHAVRHLWRGVRKALGLDVV